MRTKLAAAALVAATTIPALAGVASASPVSQGQSWASRPAPELVSPIKKTVAFQPGTGYTSRVTKPDFSTGPILPYRFAGVTAGLSGGPTNPYITPHITWVPAGPRCSVRSFC